MHIRDEKELVRTRIKERAARMSDDDRSAESRSICRRITENLPEGPQTICAYMPMKSEADILPLLKELVNAGHRIYLPRFTRSNFEFRLMTTTDELVAGKFNLPEPTVTAPLLDDKDVTVALLPGLAFDKAGHRLGRGNGGYDKWLETLRKKNPAAQVWGIALEHQLLTTIPTEPHDRPMDAIVTPREFLRCAR